MKKLILLCSLFVFMNNNIQAKENWKDLEAKSTESKPGNKARKHFQDPYRITRNDLEGREYRKCGSVKGVQAQMDCMTDAEDLLNINYPDRGTMEYGDKFYSKLSKDDAKAKIKELIELMDTVAFRPRTRKTKDIELVVDMLNRETRYIEQYVLRINPKDHRPLR